MAGGITFNFLANVKDFLRGTGDAESALDDVADSLDDLSRTASRETEKTARAIDDIGDEANKTERTVDNATEDMAASFRELARDVSVSSEKQARSVSTNARQSASTAKQAIQETKNEALQNAAETFSSFDGSATSFVDGIQGTFGGLVSSLGLISPALIPIGIAGAVSIGLISSAVTGAEQDTEDFKQRVAELAGQLIDAGNDGHRAFGAFVDDLKKIATETDDSKTNLKDLQKIASTLKVPLADVATAYLQGGEALEDLIQQNRDLLKVENDAANARDVASNSSLGALGDLFSAQGKYSDQLSEINTILTEQQKLQVGAADTAKLAAQAGLTDYSLKAGLIEQINDAYDETAVAVDNYINAETGIFDTQAYIESMDARSAALRDYQTTLASTDLDPEAISFLNSQGQEAAAAFLAGYVAATPAQQADLNRIWTDAASANSSSYTTQISDAFKNTQVTGPTVVPQVPSGDDILSGLQKQLNKKTLTVSSSVYVNGVKVY